MSYRLNRDERGVTETERRFLDLLREGLSMSQIAKEMGVHRSRVYKIRQQLRDKGVMDDGSEKRS